MKAIVVKINDKPVVVSRICELTTKQFLELKRESEKVVQGYENQHENDLTRIKELEELCEELTKKINYLGKQIAIDRGEIEEDDEKEYELVLVNHEIEHPTINEPAEIIEPQTEQESEGQE